jgi:lactoylglutathione lyase
MIEIERVDHVGIRVADADRAIAFYGLLGFEVHHRSTLDAVIIIRNAVDVELNLICNADNANGGDNILMDMGDKFAGLTHLALRVASLRATIETLNEHAIAITQGPVAFEAGGHVSVFVRDPDRNVLELRGREEDLSGLPGVTVYRPEN